MSRLKFLKDKIVDANQARLIINSWKMMANKVVFTNGCFDILHKGHVTYLAKAADFGNKLVIGINADVSVKRQGKGPERPVNDEEARATLLAALGFVDMVVLFEGDTPLDLITLLAPDVLVKGADYDPDETDPASKKYIVGSDVTRNQGGEVKVVELEAGFSTTAIIGRLKQ
jgi:rfaE bifunctional protein nucleotidyltransferase chain/domain